MTDLTIALKEYLSNIGLDSDADFLRQGVELLSQLLIDAEATEQIGAGKYERSDGRQTYRNGARSRRWETRVGELRLSIPKLRQGSFFPSLLEPRRPAEQALLTVVQEAYVKGVSTRKVDALAQALGLDGMDKSKVSRICKELDQAVQEFRERPLQASYPYLWLDALYLKVRQNGRIVSLALVIALGVDERGELHLLGFDLGASEEMAFWLAFLRSLVRRGVKQVQLVISDAHEGLKQAIGQVLAGSSWQRCRVHFMRNLLAHIPKRDKKAVAAAVRLIFDQLTRASAGAQLRRLVTRLTPSYPEAAQLLQDAEHDILAYKVFPPEHWRRIHSTNPLERVNKEIRRRTRVIGIFPDRPATIRLVGTLLREQDDDWRGSTRKYFSAESMRPITQVMRNEQEAAETFLAELTAGDLVEA
jgi:transposase-like protein